MKRNRKIFLIEILILIFVSAGCAFHGSNLQQYEEIPSMLNVLTNKAQIAVEDGVFNTGGEQAVIEFIRTKNSNVLSWFTERNYELKIGVIADTAVVMVCDQNKPIYEDTYCKSGAPDKNHINSYLQSCEITMSEIEIAGICK
ncbi:MAG: hypothetical protein PHZ02_12990 [Desulfocapsaceae bacterium]|nr:hypothetical protein [Desulfocapsaceae bacterium]